MVRWKSKAEFTEKAIRHAKVETFFKALEKLDEAEAVIQKMGSINNRHHYESAWFEFTDLIEESWVRFFEEGKAASSKFEPWAGTKNKKRRRDELINYVIYSRHQSQHGNPSLEWSEPSVMLSTEGGTGWLKDFVLYKDLSYEVDYTPIDEDSKPKLEYCPGRPALPNIKDRSGDIKSPSTHAGNSISELEPEDCAKLVVGYYRKIYLNAHQIF